MRISTTESEDVQVKLETIISNQRKILESITNIGTCNDANGEKQSDINLLGELEKIVENLQDKISQKINKIPDQLSKDVKEGLEKILTEQKKQEVKQTELLTELKKSAEKKATVEPEKPPERKEEPQQAPLSTEQGKENKKSRNTDWKCYRRPDMTDICYYRNICWDGRALVFLNESVTGKVMIRSPDIGSRLEFEPKYWEPQSFPVPKGIYVPFSNEFNNGPYWLNPNSLENKEVLKYPGKAVWLTPFNGPPNNIWIWAKSFFGLYDAQVTAFISSFFPC